MGISDEAARLREAVPEQFQAGSQIGALTRAFPSLLVQNPYANAIALEDAAEPQTDVERINKAATIEGDELNERRLAENAGMTAGRIEVTGLGKQKLDQTRAQEKAKADADARMQQILALQAQIGELDIQIGNLEDALAYLARTGDVEGTMEKPGVQAAIDAWNKKHPDQPFDPNDPNAATILKGIIEDDIKAKKEQKAEAEQKLADQSADARAEMEANAERSGQSLETREQRENHISMKRLADLDSTAAQAIQAASDVEDLEQRLLTLEDLERLKGTSTYIDKIDEFIAGAEPDVLSEIVKMNSHPDISLRIQLTNLKQEIADLDEFKGTPDYPAYLEMVIGEKPEAVRQALREESDLDEAVAAALYEPFSDTLDKPQSTAEAQPKPDSVDEPISSVASLQTSRQPGPV